MKKPLFNRVTIVGVGLIGGSLGLAIKKRRLAKLVVGVVHHKKTVTEAFQRGALDIAALDLKKGVKGADLVILCGPVSVILDQLKILSRFLDKKTIVVDVGSSKETINRAAKKHLTRNVFVGCHPMAGSEKCGIRHASADLFKSAVCFLTSRHNKVGQFWRALGATPVFLEERRHDRWVAGVSHLPHILAFALFQKLNWPDGKKFDLNPSFKDIARLAKSHPKVWTDILSTNRTAALNALHDFEKNLHVLKRFLRSGERAALNRLIANANKNADKIVTT